MNNYAWSREAINGISTAAGLSPAQTGGPTIKTGPNRGKNRTRRGDGRWRKKRNDAGIPRHLFFLNLFR